MSILKCKQCNNDMLDDFNSDEEYYYLNHFNEFLTCTICKIKYNRKAFASRPFIYYLLDLNIRIAVSDSLYDVYKKSNRYKFIINTDDVLMAHDYSMSSDAKNAYQVYSRKFLTTSYFDNMIFM